MNKSKEMLTSASAPRELVNKSKENILRRIVHSMSSNFKKWYFLFKSFVFIFLLVFLTNAQGHLLAWTINQWLILHRHTQKTVSVKMSALIFKNSRSQILIGRSCDMICFIVLFDVRFYTNLESSDFCYHAFSLRLQHWLILYHKIPEYRIFQLYFCISASIEGNEIWQVYQHKSYLSAQSLILR